MRRTDFVKPVEVYRSLQRRIGRDEVFLTESFSRDDGAYQAATIGFGRILTVSASGTAVRFSGYKTVLPILALALADIGLHLGDDGHVTLGVKGDLWSVLTLVQKLFVVERAPEATGLQFGFFGYLGYDLGGVIEPLQQTIASNPDAAPDLQLSIFRTILDYDAVKQTCAGYEFVSPDFGEVPAGHEAMLTDVWSEPAVAASPPPTPTEVTVTMTRDRYLACVATAKEHIAAGDIYQAQIGYEISIQTSVDVETVYDRLCQNNPAPYMYMADFAGRALLGASPEVLIDVQAGQITMRPLAGTIARGHDAQSDELACATLSSDEKEVAEHIMLVDLCRNDIGRVCQPGTLSVPSLLATERYSHVFHLASVVTGKLVADRSHFDVLRATFPAGTMTGAPKIRAMEIIESLEATRRGTYAGAIGWLDFAGDAKLVLCIRGATYANGRYSIRASAGVVADSVPEMEWNETRAKMAAPYFAITGLDIRA